MITDPTPETPTPDASTPDTSGPPELTADVLVVGGGLVGGAMACALALGGFRVVCIDAADPAELRDDAHDGRASAFALATQRVLDGIGLWQAVADDAAPILDITVSDGHLWRGTSPLFLHYDHATVGPEPFGYMLENRFLRRAILDRLAALEGVTHLAPARLAELDRNSRGVIARLADGRRVAARLAIGADGRGSQVREMAGIGLTRWSYRQWGIVCTAVHERPHDNVAREHFLPGGPFAILPLPGNRSSIVWTERDETARAIMALSDADFTFELGRRFGDFLGRVGVEGRRWAYPLSLQFAERYVDRRLVLVGDAAHGMHPIAGQGLNMGLRDVAALAEVLTDARRLGLDPGGADVLARFQRWRRFDNTLMLGLTDALNRLFSNDIAPLRLARDLGLAMVDLVPPLKRTFMRHAMGLAGELPRLMRGRPL